MTARKSERLMNLVICLLVARTYVSKDRIRQVVEGYRDQSDEAFEKMFERDKEELRDLGVPIEVGFTDRAFEDEPGYRIVRSEFELPEIRFEADEAAVVGLAARVWQHARLAEATSTALVKLKAAGVSVDTDALGLLEPQLAASEPAFEPLWNAVVTRTPVRFGYRRANQPEPQTRLLEPWGILSWRSHWYVVGHDRDRGEERMFRLSRIDGPVERAGRPRSYDIPPGTDVRALANQLAPAEPDRTAVLRVRSGAGVALRRRALSVEPVEPGWDRVRLAYGDTTALAEELVAYGRDLVVVEPARLRDLVVDRLRGLAARSLV